jgi:hypothetical protein
MGGRSRRNARGTPERGTGGGSAKKGSGGPLDRIPRPQRSRRRSEGIPPQTGGLPMRRTWREGRDGERDVRHGFNARDVARYPDLAYKQMLAMHSSDPDDHDAYGAERLKRFRTDLAGSGKPVTLADAIEDRRLRGESRRYRTSERRDQARDALGRAARRLRQGSRGSIEPVTVERTRAPRRPSYDERAATSRRASRSGDSLPGLFVRPGRVESFIGRLRHRGDRYGEED